MTLRAALVRLSLVVVLALTAVTAYPEDLQPLVRAGHLSVSTEFQTPTPVVPGQKAHLVISIATDTWFAGGTRISIPEVPGLVILQNEQFANNATENVDGKTWVVQRWSLDVFAQRAGDFTLPPIRLQLKINGGDAGDLEGKLFTPRTPLSVTLPAGLEEVQSWVAAPSFSASQRFDRALDALVVGDAITREITLEATDVMAMMLPTITVAEFDGLAVYPGSPSLENYNNRGETRGKRSQSISYVAEKPGQYTLPEQEFMWWDTARSELQVLTLPASIVIVGGTAAERQQAPAERSDQWLRRAAVFAAALAVLALAAWLLKHIPVRAVFARARVLGRRITDLRKPALPGQLNPPRRINPGNNAAD